MLTPDPPLVRVLIVDDDQVDREMVRRLLTKTGLAATIAEVDDPEPALDALRRGEAELVLLDYEFPRHDGLAVLRDIQALDASLPVIMLTGHDDLAIAVELMKAGAVDYIPKSALSGPRLAQSLGRAVRLRTAEVARRAAQDALRASEELSRSVLDSSHDAIEVLDRSGSLLSINASGERSFGREPRDRPWCELFRSSGRTAAERAVDEARSGRSGRFQAVRPTVAGEPLWWDVVVTPVFGLDGRPDRLVAISRDITEQQQQIEFEQQLIGIVSHDLRNPISAMVMAGRLLHERLPESHVAREIGERIVNSGERAMRLIRDLLDFTRVRTSHGLPIERRSADLHLICKQAVDEAVIANPRRVVIHEAVGDGAGRWDADRLVQVVGNLTRNALSYSRDHSRVYVRSCGGATEVSIEVHNQGEPIPRDVLPTLFQPFERHARKPDSDRSVGLGLFIVREIVAAHGGKVEVRSDAARGTLFRVELPRGS